MNSLIKKRLSITFLEVPGFLLVGVLLTLLWPDYQPNRLPFVIGIGILHLVFSLVSWVLERKYQYTKMCVLPFRFTFLVFGMTCIYPLLNILDHIYLEIFFFIFPLLYFIRVELFKVLLGPVWMILMVASLVYWIIIGLPNNISMIQAGFSLFLACLGFLLFLMLNVQTAESRSVYDTWMSPIVSEEE